jgi:hypothetical protein
MNRVGGETHYALLLVYRLRDGQGRAVLTRCTLVAPEKNVRNLGMRLQVAEIDSWKGTGAKRRSQCEQPGNGLKQAEEGEWDGIAARKISITKVQRET